MSSNVSVDQLLKEVQQLQVEKARLITTLENIGDGIIETDDSGKIVFVNDQTISLMGYSKEEMVGNSVLQMVNLKKIDGTEVQLQDRPLHKALLHNTKVSESRFNYIKKDGSLLPVAITATPVLLQGVIIGGIVVFRDITKEREVDRMKTEFISLASHQLRTPLSAMKWFAELLLDENEKLSEEQRRLITNIYKSNERMIELVNALLNISRIESGRIIIEPQPTDLQVLVNEVVLELNPKIKEKNDRLVVSVHPGLPLVNIDPKLIRNVYMNLLTNALKYTPTGGEIHVIISKTESEVISQITDSGYGIPQKDQKKIFQKFFRGDNIVKIETDGTGLGLYLAKSIVDSSGGKIWYKSEEGKGTSFWFSLPLTGSVARKGEVSIEDQKI